ncbi:hypothetical protein AX16_006687 [Volvariella volvacea WC 439]|nr:hypothetical protein AX16_006687 [Volvariella volvacea WC 439]
MSTSTSHSRTTSGSQKLSEQLVQDGFHSYLKSSLTQAKLEKLLDADMLSSAESDLMITGPALCLYFAALRSTTDPPSVPLPRTVKGDPSHPNAPLDLSYDNCPPAFVSFLRVWAGCVPRIQSLPPEQQHDLARIICGLFPISESCPLEINSIAAEIRAVAIEISQRRSFQDRYAAALQAALDAGLPSHKRATFMPPPLYDSVISPNSTPRTSLDTTTDAGGAVSPTDRAASPPPPRLPPRPSSTSLQSPSSAIPSSSSSESPAMTFIRETLYAALLDAITSTPSMVPLFKTNPPKAYFSATSLAILQVATACVINLQDDGSDVDDEGNESWVVRGVGGQIFTTPECPAELQPFMKELISLGRQAKKIEEEDTEEAIRLLQAGEDVPVPRLDRAKIILEEGIGGALNSRTSSIDDSDSRSTNERSERRRTRSLEGRAVTISNRVNALSLGLTGLRAFRERQGDVFKALTGIS